MGEAETHGGKRKTRRKKQCSSLLTSTELEAIAVICTISVGDLGEKDGFWWGGFCCVFAFVVFSLFS